MKGNRFFPSVRGVRRGPAGVAARGSVAVLVAAGVAAVPAVAQAAPIAAASSGAALCSGVSSSQVASVVGWTVPSAISSDVHTVFDKKLGISETGTVCTYGAATSITSMQHLVIFTYSTLSKVPPRATALSEIKASLQSSEKKLPKGSKFTYTINHAFGVTSFFGKISSSEDGMNFTFEFAEGWSGTKVAGATVASAIPEAKAQALEKLALDNFGI